MLSSWIDGFNIDQYMVFQLSLVNALSQVPENSTESPRCYLLQVNTPSLRVLPPLSLSSHSGWKLVSGQTRFAWHSKRQLQNKRTILITNTRIDLRASLFYRCRTSECDNFRYETDFDKTFSTAEMVV